MSKGKDILNELLVTAFNYITNIEGTTIKQMGVKLSMNEVHILEAIKESETPTMTNVANRLLITVGSLTTAIDKLVQKGYVIRLPEETDRRKVVLKLTSQSEEVIKKHTLFHNEMIDNAIKDLHITEDSDLIPIFENLVAYFHRKYEECTNKK
jgi:DNA-binding MarR family transcriptional regulator